MTSTAVIGPGAAAAGSQNHLQMKKLDLQTNSHCSRVKFCFTVIGPNVDLSPRYSSVSPSPLFPSIRHRCVWLHPPPVHFLSTSCIHVLLSATSVWEKSDNITGQLHGWYWDDLKEKSLQLYTSPPISWFIKINKTYPAKWQAKLTG